MREALGVDVLTDGGLGQAIGETCGLLEQAFTSLDVKQTAEAVRKTALDLPLSL
ncbi:hypothetical protein ACQUSR_19370 [Streptomyces sp. P1-3]|uniref:hypothetical protein n=1 Tax=Streptomyces sp. P1-3 TaxID=3421658 RepID=UPI003D36CE82